MELSKKEMISLMLPNNCVGRPIERCTFQEDAGASAIGLKQVAYMHRSETYSLP